MAEQTQNPQQPAAPAVEDLQAEITQLKTENAEQASIIDELNAQLDAQSKAAPTVHPVVKHEKKEYEVVIPAFQFKGKTYQAKELSKNKKLIEELVEAGSGVLKEKV